MGFYNHVKRMKPEIIANNIFTIQKNVVLGKMTQATKQGSVRKENGGSEESTHSAIRN